MGEEHVVLKDNPIGLCSVGRKTPDRGIFEYNPADSHMRILQGHQTSQGSKQGCLAGAVRSHDGHHLPGFGADLYPEIEGAQAPGEAPRQHHAVDPPSQRPRRRMRTSSEMANNTRDKVIAPAGCDSNAT